MGPLIRHHIIWSIWSKCQLQVVGSLTIIVEATITPAQVVSVSVYLAEDISVGVVLQEHRGGAGVVVSCGDVQRGEPDLAFGAVVDEQRHNVFMALLEGYGQGSEAVLREGRDDRRRKGRGKEKGQNELAPCTVIVYERIQ